MTIAGLYRISLSQRYPSAPMPTSVLGQLKAATKIALNLLASFLVIRLWQDQQVAATQR